MSKCPFSLGKVMATLLVLLQNIANSTKNYRTDLNTSKLPSEGQLLSIDANITNLK